MNRLEADKPTQLKYQISSIGKFPGIIDRQVQALALKPRDFDIGELTDHLLAEVEKHDEYVREIEVVPGCLAYLEYPIDLVFNETQLMEIFNRTKFLWLIGVFHYHDEKGGNYRTEFCLHYDLQSDQWIAPGKFNFMD